ncbi:GL16433 [Drosophila persimilis]|uniref:GL16433 n=1 Tax=Drosophila persimilis TaxID=7234 RepID=B4GWI5_DROPE|nr:GL16433 [Drosophila persimilis]
MRMAGVASTGVPDGPMALTAVIIMATMDAIVLDLAVALMDVMAMVMDTVMEAIAITGTATATATVMATDMDIVVMDMGSIISDPIISVTTISDLRILSPMGLAHASGLLPVRPDSIAVPLGWHLGPSSAGFFGQRACRGPWNTARQEGGDRCLDQAVEIVDISTESISDVDTDTDMATRVVHMTVE